VLLYRQLAGWRHKHLPVAVPARRRACPSPCRPGPPGPATPAAGWMGSAATKPAPAGTAIARAPPRAVG